MRVVPVLVLTTLVLGACGSSQEQDALATDVHPNEPTPSTTTRWQCATTQRRRHPGARMTVGRGRRLDPAEHLVDRGVRP